MLSVRYSPERQTTRNAEMVSDSIGVLCSLKRLECCRMVAPAGSTPVATEPPSCGRQNGPAVKMWRLPSSVLRGRGDLYSLVGELPQHLYQILRQGVQVHVELAFCVVY